MAEESKMAEASANPSPIVGMPGVPVAPKVAEKKNVFSEMFAASKKAPVVVKKENPFETTHKSKPGTILLKVSLGIFAVVAGFLFTQLSSGFTLFGTNTAQRNETAKAQVTGLQAEIQVEKHLGSVLLLEKYSKLGDEYFYDLKQSTSQYVSENKKSEYKTKVATIKPQMKEIFVSLKSNLGDVLTDEQKALSVQKVDESISSLKSKEGQADAQSILSDVQDLESTRKLLLDDAFKSTITSTDSEKTSDADYQKILTAYNAINQSVSSLIASIDTARISWSTYLTGAEAILKDIDPLFNTEFKGNLTLQSLGFKSSDSTITISGKTDTADTKNFTLISNLIDAFNISPLFKDGQQRSFSKNESSDESGATNYDSSFQVTITLETDPT